MPINVSRHGRKFVEVEVSTTPQITTGFEALFGETGGWKIGEIVADPDPAPVVATAVVVRWLVAGAQAPIDETAVPDYVLTDDFVQMTIRAPAHPELEAFPGPILILQ